MYPSPSFCWNGEESRRVPSSSNASLTTSQANTLPLKCVASAVMWFSIAVFMALALRFWTQPGSCWCQTKLWP